MPSVSHWTSHKDLGAEKAELEALLASKLFARAPSMVQFLRYVCSKYFDGEASQIKEYTIAVEAFGRSPDFHQKEDPIVRVEANRLRKRLQQYYETEGRDHSIRITIPAGQYLPVFEYRDTSFGSPGISPAEEEAVKNPAVLALQAFNAEPSQLAPAGQPTGPLLLAPAAAATEPRRIWPVLTVAVSCLFLLAAWLWWRRESSIPAGITSPDSADSALVRSSGSVATPALGDREEVRILAGSTISRYVDRVGQVWTGDRFFTGGSTFKFLVLPIQRTTDPEIYQSGREGDFQYDIPLKPGIYELRLHFAELVYGSDEVEGGGETSRLIEVHANDKPLLQSFDIVADSGGSRTADVKVFTDVAPVDGRLKLNIFAYRSRGLLNAIEILPGMRGQMRPLRMTTRQAVYFDRNQAMWGPDLYFRGGRVNARTNPISGTNEPELYQCERFGNFSYAIPVAPGRYRLTLKFAETYFGDSNLGRGGVGNRVFSVSCNGELLLKNFDIYKQAGSENRALDRTFHGLQASPQGKLVLQFVPVTNYASVSSMEVVAEPSSQRN